MTKATAKTTTLSSIEFSLKAIGANLDQARKDLKNTNREMAAARIVRIQLSSVLTDIKSQIRQNQIDNKGKGCNRALEYSRRMFADSYGESLLALGEIKFRQTQIKQFINETEEHVRNLDKMFEELKAEQK